MADEHGGRVQEASEEGAQRYKSKFVRDMRQTCSGRQTCDDHDVGHTLRHSVTLAIYAAPSLGSHHGRVVRSNADLTWLGRLSGDQGSALVLERGTGVAACWTCKLGAGIRSLGPVTNCVYPGQVHRY